MKPFTGVATDEWISSIRFDEFGRAFAALGNRIGRECALSGDWSLCNHLRRIMRRDFADCGGLDYVAQLDAWQKQFDVEGDESCARLAQGE